jgi:hypothetical protein
MSDSERRSPSRKSTTVKKSVKTRKNSANSLSFSAEKKLAFKTLAKKLGVKGLTEEQKREVLNAASSASISGNNKPAEKALIKRLQSFNTVLKSRKNEGAAAHTKITSRRKKRAEAFKAKLFEEKDRADGERERLAKSTKTRIAAKGTTHLAKLRVHGYNLSLEDHVYLTKHINDRRTRKIKENLHSQTDKDDCDKCALKDYLELV